MKLIMMINKKFSRFEIVAITVLFLVTLFILCSILAVIQGGMHYLKDFLMSEESLFSIRLSLLTACVSTVICFFIALPCAYVLAKTVFPYKNIFQTIIELPMSLPNMVLGLCLLIIFSSDAGKLLKEWGFRVVFDPKGIVAAQVIVNLSFMIRLLRTAIAEVDNRLEFIAGTLGASKWIRFVTITLPLSRHNMMAALLVTWSRALGEFGATLMLVGVTRMKTETLPASIYLNISTGDNGMAMASAIVLLIISFVTSAVTNYLNHQSKVAVRLQNGMNL